MSYLDCVVPGTIGFVGGCTGLYSLPCTLGLTVAYIVVTEEETDAESLPDPEKS